MKWSDVTSFTLGPPPSPRDPQPAADRFAAMNDEAEQAPDTPVAQPILPCEKPYIEITLTNAAGDQALAGTPYEVVVADAIVGRGTLDGDGHAKVEDVDLPDDSVLTVTLEESDDAPRRYRIQVGPPQPEPSLPDDEDAPPDDDETTDAPRKSTRPDRLPDADAAGGDYAASE